MSTSSCLTAVIVQNGLCCRTQHAATQAWFSSSRLARTSPDPQPWPCATQCGRSPPLSTVTSPLQEFAVGVNGLVHWVLSKRCTSRLQQKLAVDLKHVGTLSEHVELSSSMSEKLSRPRISSCLLPCTLTLFLAPERVARARRVQGALQ